MNKKVISKVSLLGLLVAFLVGISLPPSVSFASTNVITPYGAGAWDYLGSDTVQTNNYSTSKPFYSGGGNLKVCTSGWDYQYSESPKVILDDEDGNGPNGFQKKPDHYDSNGCAIFTGLSSWVDGSNNKADVLVEVTRDWPYTSNKEYVSIDVWD